MARITPTELKLAIDHVNDRMKRAGAEYSYKYSTRNGFQVVDAYKGTRNLFMVGCGTSKECIGALYSDAFDRMADAYVDRLRETAGEFTTNQPVRHYPGASIPLPSAEFVTASINACAGIPLEALQATDPQKVHDIVMEDYQPQG